MILGHMCCGIIGQDLGSASVRNGRGEAPVFLTDRGALLDSKVQSG